MREMFFVLSGPLITGLPIREAEVNSQISLVKFSLRRARRRVRIGRIKYGAAGVLGTLYRTRQSIAAACPSSRGRQGQRCRAPY